MNGASSLTGLYGERSFDVRTCACSTTIEILVTSSFLHFCSSAHFISFSASSNFVHLRVRRLSGDRSLILWGAVGMRHPIDSLFMPPSLLLEYDLVTSILPCCFFDNL